MVFCLDTNFSKQGPSTPRLLLYAWSTCLIFVDRFRLLSRRKFRQARSVDTPTAVVCLVHVLDFCAQVSSSVSTQISASNVFSTPQLLLYTLPLCLIFVHRFRLLSRHRFRQARSVHTSTPVVCLADVLDFCAQVLFSVSTQVSASKVCPHLNCCCMLGPCA